MLDQVKNELQNCMLADQYNSVSSQINIISKTNKLLNSDSYSSKLKETMDKYFNHPTGIAMEDMGQIVLSLQGLIPLFENVLNLYKGLDVTEMKYILYGCLYYYLLQYQSGFIDENLGKFRLEYFNIFELIKTPLESYEVESKLFLRIMQWAKKTFCCISDPYVK